MLSIKLTEVPSLHPYFGSGRCGTQSPVHLNELLQVKGSVSDTWSKSD